MKQPLRIGTRDSELALWQAESVQKKLSALGHDAVLVPIKSDGDLKLDQPLYELGITGIFTKTLDVALLQGKIDLAVHSMKDVPTQLPKGIVQTAVLERAPSLDVLVHKGTDFLKENAGVIATGSLRRKAQWLHKYPNHKVVDLRGNVNTRLIKVIENDWHGAIFALAGLERIKLLPKDALVLDWMIPAPAQGAMMVVALEKNKEAIILSAQLNHQPTAMCTQIEREFLKTLEGGCTAPIGALAKIKGEDIHFKACLHSLDGQEVYQVQNVTKLANAKGLGTRYAQELLENGGASLMKKIKNELDRSVN